MKVGIIGTGAISHKHAQAYKNIGFDLTVCTDISEPAGRRFADQWGCEFVPGFDAVCRHPHVDYVDVCTFPNFRMQPIALCAETGKHVQVQKPLSTNLQDARTMVATARKANIVLGVVSQHRFDDASTFLATALAEGRLGKLLQADCFVKWYRQPEYYARPIKGSWAAEGGGALMNQAIHGVDLLRWLAGPVRMASAKSKNWRSNGASEIAIGSLAPEATSRVRGAGAPESSLTSHAVNESPVMMAVPFVPCSSRRSL